MPKMLMKFGIFGDFGNLEVIDELKKAEHYVVFSGTIDEAK